MFVQEKFLVLLVRVMKAKILLLFGVGGFCMFCKEICMNNVPYHECLVCMFRMNVST